MKQRGVQAEARAEEAFASDIAVGDYVVHIDHGIGRFVGVIR